RARALRPLLGRGPLPGGVRVGHERVVVEVAPVVGVVGVRATAFEAAVLAGATVVVVALGLRRLGGGDAQQLAQLADEVVNAVTNAVTEVLCGSVPGSRWATGGLRGQPRGGDPVTGQPAQCADRLGVG